MSNGNETLLKAPQVQSFISLLGMVGPDSRSQKRFYRQRAHANVFIDHALD